MDKLYAIKIRQSDGTYGDEIPINVLAQNVDWDSSHTLVDILGVVNTTSPIQSQINNLVNTKASQADVNLLETRVDNIISNAGDDNTEIVDARVGADGTQYTILKNRLDTEHTQLKNAIDAIYNNALTATFTDGYYINSSGVLVASSNASVALIEVLTGDYSVKLSPVYISGGRSVCAFDKDGIFISVLQTASEATDVTVELPSECRYIRATLKTTDKSTFTVSYANSFLEKRLDNIQNEFATKLDVITDYDEKTIGVERDISNDMDVSVGYYSVNATTKVVSFNARSAGSKDRAYTIDLSAYVGGTVHIAMSNHSTGTRASGMMDSSNYADAYGKEENYPSGGFVFNIKATHPIFFASIANYETNTIQVTVNKDGQLQELISLVGNTDISGIASTVTGAIKALDDSIGTIGNPFITIQPHNFPTLPYEVVEQAGNYRLKTSIYDTKEVSGFTQLYVDLANGLDTNSGTDSSHPVKTLKKALQLYASGNSATCIHILDDATFFAEDLYGECRVKQSLAIIADSTARLVNGVRVTWEETETTGVYSATISGYTPSKVVNIADSNIAKDGVYNALKIATSLADCGAISGSYFVDASTVYVHPTNTDELSDHVVLVTEYYVRWNHSTATNDNFIYLENLNFIGANYNAARSDSAKQLGYQIEMFGINNIYQHFSGDGATAQNYDNVYFVDCTAAFSQRDCFNTHNSVSDHDISDKVIVMLNCNAREAGYYATVSQHGNNNLFTAHDGENVLRLNCHGINSDGPCFADVNGCRSVYKDCSSINLAYPGVSATGSWQFNNSQAAKPGFVTLKDCMIYDNRNNPPIYSECDIEVCKVDLANCNITGEITTFAALD